MEFEKLKGIIADVLNVDEEEITMDTTFTDDLGADSLDVYQIIMGLEEEFDIEIPQEEAEKIVSVGHRKNDGLLVAAYSMSCKKGTSDFYEIGAIRRKDWLSVSG